MPVDLNQRLSEHFTLVEFITSQTASRKGIDNTPSPEVVERLRKLCTDVLEPARVALGPLHISSGFRCEKLNKSIGGSTTSAHCKGYAADVIPQQVTRREFAKWVKDNCKFDQIILEFGTPENPDWIHVSNEPRFRKQVLITKNGGYAPATV
jgi:zinc D-Ala-D-Ala carboxypeptidase